MRCRAWWVAGFAVLAALGSSGAGWAAVRPASSTTPPSVSPCSLLNSAQRHQLQVKPGAERMAALGGPACAWEGITQPWGGEYLGALLSGATPGGNPAPSINGRPTAEYQPPWLDSAFNCVYLVSLTSELTLWAQYGSPGNNQPGLNHRVACRNAQAAASDMVSTFGALPH